MKKFRLPRKLKKKLHKTMWLYPYDDSLQGYLMATPYNSEKDYNAYKLGIIRDIMDRKRK